MIRTKPRYLTVGKVPLTVLRREAGVFLNGRYIEAVETPIEIMGNIQPIFRGIRTNLSEKGDTTRVTFLLLTNDYVRQKKEGPDGWEADIILWENEELEVESAAPYKMGVLDHYEAICVRREVS